MRLRQVRGHLAGLRAHGARFARGSASLRQRADVHRAHGRGAVLGHVTAARRVACSLAGSRPSR